MPISVSGSQITFNDSSVQNTSPFTGGFAMRNRIINGDFRIDQRNAGASVTVTSTSAVTFAVDRTYGYGSVTSKFSMQRNAGSVTPPAGFSYYLGATSLSSYTVGSSDLFVLGQTIEGLNVADLNWGTANASTVTLSFWVRSSLTGTFGGALRNDSDTRSYPFTYTISSANTWEQKSITVAGDTTGTWLTTNGAGLKLIFGLGVGSTLSGTAGAWAGASYQSATGATSVVGTNGATFYITGVQLEKGSTATSFDYRPYGTELALCQRYYEKTYNTDVAIGTATAVGRMAPSVTSDAGNNASTWWGFAVEKRAAPTVTLYRSSDGVSGSWNYERSGSTTTGTATAQNSGTRGVRIYVSTGAAWVAVWMYGHAVAESEL
jgi:hypothetical protein